jgi:hypothetical protein
MSATFDRSRSDSIDRLLKSSKRLPRRNLATKRALPDSGDDLSRELFPGVLFSTVENASGTAREMLDPGDDRSFSRRSSR